MFLQLTLSRICACGKPYFWNSVTWTIYVTLLKFSCIQDIMFRRQAWKTWATTIRMSSALCLGSNISVISGQYGFVVTVTNKESLPYSRVKARELATCCEDHSGDPRNEAEIEFSRVGTEGLSYRSLNRFWKPWVCQCWSCCPLWRNKSLCSSTRESMSTKYSQVKRLKR